MSKKNSKRVAAMIIFCFLIIFIVTLSSVYAEDISARLVSLFDGKNGKATTMLVGYCKDSPVVIGPGSVAISQKEFSACTSDDVSDIIPEKNLAVKKVTKFSNNGKEIVAEVVLTRGSQQMQVVR
jgi:uncharacterized protein YebE (UPF0316 family)